MKENSTFKKSILLRFGLLAGFKIFLWRGEEIISRIFIMKKPAPQIHAVQATDDRFPPSSWILIGTRPCCMVLDEDQLVMHVLPDVGRN
jgi:hypothetical protein